MIIQSIFAIIMLAAALVVGTEIIVTETIKTVLWQQLTDDTREAINHRLQTQRKWAGIICLISFIVLIML